MSDASASLASPSASLASASAATSTVLKAENRTLPGFEEDRGGWKEPFFFVQAADTQLGMIVNYGDGSIAEQYPNVTWEREMELCRLTVEKVNRMSPPPAFFIVCGDLVDAMPDKWPEIRKEQEKDFMEVFKELSVPLVCVCGNHDVGNKPTKDTIANYKSSFGDDYFSFWHGGVHFMVLNSQFYEDCSLTQDLADEQDKWLDDQLTKPAAHKVIFQHIPWFVERPEEDKIYFNIELGLRQKMLQKFKSSGVSKIFCGHYHRNAGGWDGDDMELVVTSAVGAQIGNDGHGFRIVNVGQKSISHRYYKLEDVPAHNNKEDNDSNQGQK